MRIWEFRDVRFIDESFKTLPILFKLSCWTLSTNHVTFEDENLTIIHKKPFDSLSHQKLLNSIYEEKNSYNFLYKNVKKEINLKVFSANSLFTWQR